MTPDQYDRADYDSADPANFQDAEIEEICSCGVKKVADGESGMKICPDCGV